MKAMAYHEYGSPEVLELHDHRILSGPGASEPVGFQNREQEDGADPAHAAQPERPDDGQGAFGKRRSHPGDRPILPVA